jgi:peroxiredoxin
LAALTSPVCHFGENAHDFNLESTHGKLWSLNELRGVNGLLVMFISNHCPYVKAVREKIVRDTSELISLGINSVAIMPNDTYAYPGDSMENMREVADQFDFPFPYLLDESQQVAKTYGAVCTPDFFGYNAELKLQYRGRLDAAGARPDANSEPRELFEAMKLVADTGQGPRDQIPSIGCSIKWKL